MSCSESYPLRWVVLRHEGVAQPHYDLMFETAAGSELATWRSETWPIAAGGALVPLAPHRRAYLDYEGEVSGGRGHVIRIAAGRHVVLENTPQALVVGLEDGTKLRLGR